MVERGGEDYVVEDGLYVKRQDQTGHFDGDVFSAHIHIT